MSPLLLMPLFGWDSQIFVIFLGASQLQEFSTLLTDLPFLYFCRSTKTFQQFQLTKQMGVKCSFLMVLDQLR